ncbi:MAG: UDP-N-acetylmuramoyl-tripeptide--D-alanyl-D-alanine ligase [Syntrophomonadaceae bacterium]|jgi:UDP-N-acetylmuramoyl-tripeptide--D-alanyl-D-alanine ligase
MNNGTIVVIAVLAPWLLYTILKIKKAAHFLQLNGYFSGRYVRWLLGNPGRAMGWLDGLPLVAVVLLWLQQGAAAYFVWALIYLLMAVALFNAQRQEGTKKKLVYTSRVKRLLLVTALLMLLLIYWTGRSLWIPGVHLQSLLVLYTVSILTALLLLLANILIWPLEKAINFWYYQDAEQILANQSSLKVIGITGSYGKTSTKNFLQRILAEHFNVLATPESYNTTMGVILTTRTRLKPTDEVFIVEMGARKKGDIKEICELVKPGMGILTSIGEQHLETFKVLENIKQTKYELIQSLGRGGMAFVNGDDENIRSLPEVFGVRYIRYGIEADDLDYRAGSIQYDSRGSVFTVNSRQGLKGVFRTRLLGRHNIYNILAATAVACEMGMDMATIALAVRNLVPVQHRLEVKRSRDYLIIDDAFNANPVGSRMALEVLAKMEGGSKIMITPGMVELGDREYEINYEFGRAAAKVCDYVILVGPRQTLPIQEAFKENLYPAHQYFVARNLNQALDHLKIIARPGSVVLFENDLPDTYNE